MAMTSMNSVLLSLRLSMFAVAQALTSHIHISKAKYYCKLHLYINK